MTDTSTIDAPLDSGRARIMDEAATSFLHQGYPATSLRHIANAVGMKAGSIYYHFASKEELLTEILIRGISVMQTAFDDAERATAVSAAAPSRPMSAPTWRRCSRTVPTRQHT